MVYLCIMSARLRGRRIQSAMKTISTALYCNANRRTCIYIPLANVGVERTVAADL